VYGLVVLVALLAAADAFDWPLTRTAAAALWQLAQQLLTAGGALLLACLGARWARDLSTPAGPVSPEQRAAHYTALALIAGTTAGAVGVLLSGKGALIALVALPVVGFLLWFARGYLPDVMAGWKLRTEKVSQVWIDGAACQVSSIGVLMTEVGLAGESGRVPNRLVLEAATHGPLAATGRR
jgi:hypothetical protein